MLNPNLNVKVITLLIAPIIFLNLVYNLDGNRSAWGADNIIFLKFIGVILASFALIFMLKKKKTFIVLLSYYLFSFMLIGAMYELIVNNQQLEETYTSRALCFIFLVLGCEIANKCYIQEEIWRINKGVLFVFSLLMLLGCIFFIFGLYPLGVNSNGAMLQIYHTTIFLPACFFIFFKTRFKALPYLAVAIGTSLIIFLTTKVTALIVSLLILFFALATTFNFKKNTHEIRLLLYLTLIIMASSLFFLIQNIVNDKVGIEGEAGIRITALKLLMDRFLESPIWGNFFTASPIIKFSNQFDAPSHLDYLDLLANGGLIWFLPFLYLNFKAIKNSLKLLNHSAGANFLIFMYFCSSIVIFINPALAVPRIAFFWLFRLGLFSAINYKRISK